MDRTGSEKVLHSFGGQPNDGEFPSSASLLRDKSGNLYGVTPNGGAYQSGIVFELTPDGAETILYTFTGLDDGAYPYAGLIEDEDGNLYGTADVGGVYGAGVVFKIDKTGNETTLYSFLGGSDGDIPSGTLLRDQSGNLYGTTTSGGGPNAGTVYMINRSGRETQLFEFQNQDGCNPNSLFFRPSNDGTTSLYGTTAICGTYNAGTVFKLSLANAGDSAVGGR